MHLPQRLHGLQMQPVLSGLSKLPSMLAIAMFPFSGIATAMPAPFPARWFLVVPAVASPGFAGAACERCAAGYSRYPSCQYACSIYTTCNNHAQRLSWPWAAFGGVCYCVCYPQYAGSYCDRCAPGYYNYPSCTRIPCSIAANCNGHATSVTGYFPYCNCLCPHWLRWDGVRKLCVTVLRLSFLPTQTVHNRRRLRHLGGNWSEACDLVPACVPMHLPQKLRWSVLQSMR